MRTLALVRTKLKATKQAAYEAQTPGHPAERRWAKIITSLIISVANVFAITALMLPLDQRFAANLVPIAYLLPVIYAATRWGVAHATLASVAAIACADFFFLDPVYSFRIEDPNDAVDLLLFLIVALVSSNLASRLRRETERLRRREQELRQLYDFSRRLATCFTVPDLILAIQHFLSLSFKQKATFFVVTADGHCEFSEPAAIPKQVLDASARIAVHLDAPSHSIVDEMTQDVWMLRAITSETSVHGAIAINIGGGSPKSIKSNTQHIEAILEEVALTLKRLDIGKAMEDARLHLQGQLLRDAFHGTLSHELCSPLASIRGSASVLNSIVFVRADKQASALVDGILEEVAELEGFIQNLLNATRVTSGGLSPRHEWADPHDIVNAAVKRRGRRLASHKISMVFGDELPLIEVDSGLVEESLGQILENAAKYSPSGSPIVIDTQLIDGTVTISVTDEGIGIPSQELPHLGRRSFRGAQHKNTTPGSGLGFWIASTFIRASGGTIAVANYGQGTRVTISLTASETAPFESAALDND